MIHRTIAAAALIATATIGQACEVKIMGCTFGNGANSVQICLEGRDVTYSYADQNGTLELGLRTPVTQIDYLPWPGIGASIWETITFINGDYGYAMTAGFDKDPDRESGYGGISVMQDGAEIDYLSCDPQSVDWTYGNHLARAKRAEGLCWGGSPDIGWQSCN